VRGYQVAGIKFEGGPRAAVPARAAERK
jgi:hypothetical protein